MCILAYIDVKYNLHKMNYRIEHVLSFCAGYNVTIISSTGSNGSTGSDGSIGSNGSGGFNGSTGSHMYQPCNKHETHEYREVHIININGRP